MLPTLDMEGAYELTNDSIDAHVTRTSCGNYALGHDTPSQFTVSYVGRSDDDVNFRLKQWVGKKSSYTHFKFSYATSPKAAFEKECKNYHDFGGSEKLDNEKHPERADGTDWKCPVCGL